MVADRLEGDTTMANFTAVFRAATGRDVVDKTGLAGYYHVTMNFDMMAVRRGPDVNPPPNAAPSVFTAVQEQLGLKLQSSRAKIETLAIDHLERPTPN